MPDPNNTRVYRGHTGLQSKVPTQDRSRGNVPGNQQSHIRNAQPPLGVGMYTRPGRDGAMDADPPLGVGVVMGDLGLPLSDGVGVSTPDAPSISTQGPQNIR